MTPSISTSLITLACLSWITPLLVSADLTCLSPSGSHNLGDTVTLQWSDNGAYPRIGDVYSTTATVYCSSSFTVLTTMNSIINGQSWTIPQDILSQCQGNQVYVYYSGEQWDSLHLLHVAKYTINCRDISFPIPVTNPTDSTTGTSSSSSITPLPSNNTASVTVISGISTVITSPATLTQSGNPVPGQPTATSTLTSTLTPNQPPPPGTNTTIIESKTNILAAVVGTLAGIIVIALIIFGMIRARKSRLQKQEALQRKIEKSGFGGASPDNSILGFAPLQHQAEMREYKQHPSQTSSLQRSISNAPLHPRPSYRNVQDYGRGQNYDRYVEGYGYVQEHVPEDYLYNHVLGTVATQQPTDQEYYGRMQNSDGDNISPMSSGPIPLIPFPPVPHTASIYVSEGSLVLDDVPEVHDVHDQNDIYSQKEELPPRTARNPAAILDPSQYSYYHE